MSGDQESSLNSLFLLIYFTTLPTFPYLTYVNMLTTNLFNNTRRPEELFVPPTLVNPSTPMEIGNYGAINLVHIRTKR